MTKLTFDGSTWLSRFLVNYIRYFPGHFSKVRFIRSLIKLLFPNGLIVKRGKAMIKINCSDYIDWSIFTTGSYEPKTLELAERLMSSGGTFVDIGANFGLYTCCLGVLPGVECFAIEPAARAFTTLQDNIYLNPSIHAHLYNIALGSSCELVEIEDFDSSNMGKIRILLDDKHEYSRCHTVSMISLNDLVTHAKINSISLIKIDVEGYELPILKGFDWSSAIRPQHIIAEFTDYSVRAEGNGRLSLLEFFKSHDYIAYSIEGQPIQDIVNLPDLPEDNIWFKDNRV